MGNKVIPGINDLQTLYPEIAAEFDIEANGILPSQITAGSSKKFTWICPKGHHYETTPYNRTAHGFGCQYCSGHAVLKGFNDLATVRPDLAAELVDELNNGITAYTITAGSAKKLHWKCPVCGYVYASTVVHRNLCNSGCPKCSNKKISVKASMPKAGKSLAEVHPEIAAELHPTRNGNISPYNVPYGSGRKLWFTCSACGYEYEASVNDRNNGAGCPKCLQMIQQQKRKQKERFNEQTNIREIPEGNRLVDKVPQILELWDTKRNGDITPYNISYGSQKEVHLICKSGHTFSKAAVDVYKTNCNCPFCFSSTSYGEQFIYWAFKQVYPGKANNGNYYVLNRAKHKGYEIDIVIKPLKLYIEYSGAYWHKEKAQRDLEKKVVCNADGYRLITIIEDKEITGVQRQVDSIYYKGLGVNRDQQLKEIFEMIAKEYKLDTSNIDYEKVAKLAVEYSKGAGKITPGKSLLDKYPEVAKRWSKRNLPVLPSDISAHSNKQFYFICKQCGLAYKKTVADEVRGTGKCPLCTKYKHIHRNIWDM